MKEPLRIPGTSWLVNISSPYESPKTLVVEFIKGPHVLYEFIIEKDGTLEEIFGKFIKTEDISVPRNRLENLISSLDEVLFELEKSKSVEQKSLNSMMKLSVMKEKKILILGLAGAGKTCIYEVIFKGKNWNDIDIQNLPPTHGIQRYRHGSRLYVWDLGGQKAYIEEYHKKVEEIFPSTTVLIYVIDAGDPMKFEKSREEFFWALVQMKEYSPEGLIFCFIHKMDKFSNPEETYNGIKSYFNKSVNDSDQNITIFHTSIMDDSIYTAMSQLFKSIIPKSKKLDILSENLKDQIGVYNVVVLEKRTGLPICSSSNLTSSTLFDDTTLVGTVNRIWDGTFKLAEDLELVNMNRITVQCGNGYLFIEEFEENLLLMLISPDLQSIEDQQNQEHINEFEREMKKYL